jgi:hypothetical protein
MISLITYHMKRIHVSPNVLETRRQAKLKQIHSIGPVVAASLVKIHRKCGNKACRCATGEGHPAHILTFKVKGKTKSVYVPVSLVPEVKTWVENHKVLKYLVREVTKLSLALIHRHVAASRGGRKRKGPNPRT